MFCFSPDPSSAARSRPLGVCGTDSPTDAAVSEGLILDGHSSITVVRGCCSDCEALPQPLSLLVASQTHRVSPCLDKTHILFL